MDNNGESDNINDFEKFVNWMEKSINPDIDPCEDFFEYACGRFNAESYDKSRGEYPPPRYGDAFQRILENEIINCSLIKKARDFYNSLPTHPATILQDEGVIEFCGGFPVFHDNWTSENFNWIKAAAILSTIDLDTILSCSVEYLDNRKIISVNTLLPHQYEKESIEDTLREFEISEKKIWEIINDVNTIVEQFNRISNNDADYAQYLTVRKTFSELREAEFDYQTYFESFLGENLNDDDIFLLNYEQPGYLDRFLNIFAEASSKIVANYIMYRALYYGGSERGNWLYYLTLKHFTPIMFTVGFENSFNQDGLDKRRYVSKVLRNSYERYDKPEVDSDNINQIILNREEEILEYINSHFGYEQIKAEYDDLEISSDNFFENMVNIRRHGSPASIRKCYSYRHEEQDIYLVSKYLLEFFVQHYEKPIIYYFSGWNAETWEAICECIITTDEMKFHFEAFDSIVECIKLQIKSINPTEDQQVKEEEEEEDMAAYWMRTYICGIVKLRQAYEDYKIWMFQNEDEVERQDEILKRLNLNSRKAFFVSFVQQYCFEEAECRMAAILAIANCEEFAKEFDCKPDSRMNPKNKCKIKWNKN